MELPTASISQEASQSSGRESRESSNANCAKSLIGVRFFKSDSTRPAPLECEWIRDDSRDSRSQIRVIRVPLWQAITPPSEHERSHQRKLSAQRLAASKYFRLQTSNSGPEAFVFRDARF